MAGIAWGLRRRIDAEPAAKRQAIIETATEVFAREGFSAARIGDIARRAKVSSRTIYDLFSDKAALFEDVVRRAARIGPARLGADNSPATASAPAALLRAHAQRFADLIATPDVIGLARSFFAQEPYLQPSTRLEVEAGLRAVEQQFITRLEACAGASIPDGPSRIARLLGEIEHGVLLAPLVGMAARLTPRAAADLAVDHALAGLTQP